MGVEPFILTFSSHHALQMLQICYRQMIFEGVQKSLLSLSLYCVCPPSLCALEPCFSALIRRGFSYLFSSPFFSPVPGKGSSSGPACVMESSAGRWGHHRADLGKARAGDPVLGVPVGRPGLRLPLLFPSFSLVTMRKTLNAVLAAGS